MEVPASLCSSFSRISLQSSIAPLDSRGGNPGCVQRRGAGRRAGRGVRPGPTISRGSSMGMLFF